MSDFVKERERERDNSVKNKDNSEDPQHHVPRLVVIIMFYFISPGASPLPSTLHRFVPLSFFLLIRLLATRLAGTTDPVYSYPRRDSPNAIKAACLWIYKKRRACLCLCLCLCMDAIKISLG